VNFILKPSTLATDLSRSNQINADSTKEKPAHADYHEIDERKCRPINIVKNRNISVELAWTFTFSLTSSITGKITFTGNVD